MSFPRPFTRLAVLCLITPLAALALTGCPASQPAAQPPTALPPTQAVPTQIPPAPSDTPSPPTTTLAATVTGIPNPCRFLSVAEVEAVVGGSLVGKPSKAEGVQGVTCRYFADDKEGNVRLVVTVITDADLAGQGKTAAEWFASVRRGEELMATRIPKNTVEDVPGLGEQAYYRESSMLALNVLGKGVIYDLSMIGPKFGGKGSKEALLNFARLVVERAR